MKTFKPKSLRIHLAKIKENENCKIPWVAKLTQICFCLLSSDQEA